MESTSKTKTIARNSFFLYIRLGLSIIIGLLTSRIILKALGVVDYGVYNVVGGVSTMFVFLNSTMSVSTSRYVAFALGTRDYNKLSSIYCQAKIIHYILGFIVFLLIETIGIWMLNEKLNIPISRHNAALWILQSTAVVAILNIISTPDMSLIIAHEKMKSFAYISLFDSFAKLIATIMVIYYGGDKLVFYAILMMLIQIVDRLTYYIYCRMKFSEAKASLKYSKEIFVDMISFAGWNLLGNMAVMTIEQGVTILLNVFFGPAINAARGLASSFSSYVSSFANNARMAINPQITKSYAEGNLAYMHKLIALSSLSCYYLLLLVTVPLLFIADYILQLWLGEVPSFTSVFFKLTMIYTIVNSFGNPVIIGVHATGKIRKFQLVEALIMLLTLPGAYVLLKNGFPASSVYISMIVFAILAQVGRLVVILPKINMSFRKYNQSILMPALKVLLFAFFLYSSLRFLIDKHGLVIDLSFALISFICLVVAIFYLGLNKEERINLCNFIRKKYESKTNHKTI